MLADLVAGSLDLAVLLTEGAALGIARGLAIVPVSLYTRSPLIWGVHTAPGSRFGTLDALRGARFAISRAGSGSHLMSLAMALERGWPVEARQFVVIHDLKGAIAAFREGAADAFLWERFTTEPEVAAGNMQRIGEFVAPWPAWVLCAQSEVWHARRASIMETFTSVTSAAGRLARDPEAASRIAARYGLREAAVAAWLERTEWVSGPVPPEAALASARAMLEAAGAIAPA